MKVVVGICGQETEGAVREGNDANLSAPKPSFRHGGRDEETGHVREPDWLVIEAILGNGYLLHGTARDVHGEESADILWRRLDDGNHDSFSIGRPCECQVIDVKFLVMEEITFECAIAPSDLEVSHMGIAMLVQVGEALAIW